MKFLNCTYWNRVRVLPIVCGLLTFFVFGNVHAQSYFDDSDYYGLPWVKNLSRPNKIENGLDGRHLSIWASHGRVYNPTQGNWRWQRVNLFGTNEDLFSQTFVIPYIIPMLENAGAVVWTPRERDWQNVEAVVDNDQKLPGYKEQGKWMKSSEPGFAMPDDVLQEGDAPFIKGTARWSKVRRKKASSIAKYSPYLPMPGKYAVYVSYQTLQNSIPDAHYTVVHKGVKTHFTVNQTMGGSTWVYLGTFDFGCDDDNYVTVDNVSKMKGIVTTDAVRFGGGMGNVERGGSVSGLPRCLEGARYNAQWSGAPYNVYSSRQGTDDYSDDINVRPLMTNWIAGGSMYAPEKEGKGVPLEMSLAVHSDTGYHLDRSIVGTLGICTTDFNDCRLSDGESRMISYDFVEQMLSQINKDITCKYGRWNTRGIWDKNYAETRIPGIPAAILEMFSHENLSDMLYGHDPNFKFTLSRSVYKSVVRYIAAKHNKKAVIQPLAPHRFRVLMDSYGRAVLSWEETVDSLEPSAKPDSYIVYMASGNEDYDNGTVVRARKTTVTLEADKVYRFKVTAANSGGQSLPSEELACVYHPGGRQILVVNGFRRLAGPAVKYNEMGMAIGFDMAEDPGVSYGKTACWTSQLPFLAGNDFNYTTEHVRAIATMKKFSVASCSSECIGMGDVALSKYRLLDLILGNQRNDGYSLKRAPSISPIMRSELRYFGGALLVSGSYVGSDNQAPADSTFLAEALYTDYVCKYKDQSDSAQVVTGMGVDFDVYRALNEDHYASTSSDVLQPLGNAFPAMLYADGSTAAIACKERRSFVMGFPLECIRTEEQRGLCMRSVLKFLLE